jgi:hypothetical protein
MSLRTALRTRPLAVAALLIGAIKVCQFAIDRTPLFFSDSGAFIQNAVGVKFVSFRSYFYAWLIRLVAVPAASLTLLVAAQVLLGGLTAWLVAAMLRRHFAVRPWIAIAAAVVFACDPMQVLHERMVMTETTALLAMVATLLVALEYLRSRQLRWLVMAAVTGIVLVGLRIVYLPVVLAMAVALPLAPGVVESWRRRRVANVRVAVTALVVSCAATAVCHAGYRHFTGYLANSQPVYHTWTGLFQVATVAPLLKPADTDVPWIAALVTAQQASALPLSNFGWRVRQLWDAGGFVSGLRDGFGGDERAAEHAAGVMARHAVLRDPVGFARLAALTYLHYWYDLRDVRVTLRTESGLGPSTFVDPFDEPLISRTFGFDTGGQHALQTPARRYYLFGRWWILILLAVPFAGVAVTWRVLPDQRLAAGLLAVWNWLVIMAVCCGAVQTVYRYLHPFSFTGAVAIGLLVEAAVRSRVSVALPPTPGGGSAVFSLYSARS